KLSLAVFFFLQSNVLCFYFFFQAEDGIRDRNVTGVQTCALPICRLLAAHLLEAEADDIEFNEGVYSVKGDNQKQKTFQEIAKAANFAWDMPEGMEPGLEEKTFFDPSNFTDRKSVV